MTTISGNTHPLYNEAVLLANSEEKTKSLLRSKGDKLEIENAIIQQMIDFNYVRTEIFNDRDLYKEIGSQVMEKRISGCHRNVTRWNKHAQQISTRL